jgi:hypothetical protein
LFLTLRPFAASLLVVFGVVLTGGRPAMALPVVLIDDDFANGFSNQFFSAPDTFTTSVETYTVNSSGGTGAVRLNDNGVEYVYANRTTGDIFMTFDSVLGNLYEVDFDTLAVGSQPVTHTLTASAVDGVGLGGTALGNSGAIGADSSGNFTFTAASTATTIRMLGTLGSGNNSSADIFLTRLIITTPEPSTALLLGGALLGLAVRGRRRKA